jgi:hypothetical protein
VNAAAAACSTAAPLRTLLAGHMARARGRTAAWRDARLGPCDAADPGCERKMRPKSPQCNFHGFQGLVPCVDSISPSRNGFLLFLLLSSFNLLTHQHNI